MLKTTNSLAALLLYIFLSENLLAQPSNDNCSSPVSLTPSTSCTAYSTTLYLATTGTPASACGTAYDEWFSFTVPASSTCVTIDVAATGSQLSSANTFFEAFSGSACSPTLMGSCTAAGTTLLLTGLTPSATYYVRVFTSTNPNANPSNKWNFTICATYYTTPSNDNCAGATSLTVGTTNNSGTVWLATTSAGIPTGCATGTPDDDVWYSFVATSTNATVSLSSVGSNLSTSGAMVQLFSGSCGALTSLACGTNSASSSSLTVGNTYYIRVYSSGAGSIGGFPSGSDFSITVNANYFPSNDECVNAISLPTAVSCYNSEGTLTGATASSGVPIGSCTGNPDDDVWYKFVATKSNPTITLSSLAANITGTGAGSRLQLLSGSCGSLSSLSCGTTSISASGLTVGNTYYVRVYSNASIALTAATFNICVTEPSPAAATDSTTTLFNMDTVAKNLGYPWEITYGPDDSLWITEARGYRVLRISSSRTQSQKSIAPQQVLKIPLGSSLVSFDRSVGTWPQGGMEGLAIHPEFMTDPSKRWIYIAYVYSGTCPSSASAPCYFRSKIVRCQFYFSTDAGNPTSVPKKDTLVILDTVISNLPGSNDHNSGRLKIGPVTEGPDSKYRLYYTIGDMGAGQFNNSTRPNYAQTKDTCEGKILRLNTEPDGDGVPGSPIHEFDKWRQWIPNDNPFTHSVFTSLRTPIFSYGHRNAQGLAWGNVNGVWRLYSSEHGDRSDDELNWIQSGKNYGWPKVTGVADDNYNTSDNSTDGFTMNDILAGQTVADEKTWANAQSDYKDPLFSFFNWSAGQIETINSGNIFTWPTIAPSSVDFYNSNQIGGWANSILVTSLKYGIFRLKLNSTGTGIDSTVCTNATDTFPLMHSWRVRDIAISPNGGYIWAVIDSTGSTSGPTGGFNGSSSSTKDGGKVIMLTYKNLSALPVRFISFNGMLTPQKTIQLYWNATIDQDHRYFEIEKSFDGGSFFSIGKTFSPPYKFIDQHPVNGNNYYRLKAVDVNGHANYSRIVNIVYHETAITATAYPNPVKDLMNVRITGADNSPVTIQISNVTGQQVYQKQFTPSSQANEMKIDLSTWNSGIYLLKILNKDQQLIAVQKLVKQ